MRVFNQIVDLKRSFANVAVALGTFDGIHKGHQKVICKAVDLARQNNGTSMVLTFSNHPLSIINPSKCPPQIMTSEQKEQIIAELGIDVVLNIPFSKEILTLSPAAFIDVLHRNIDLSYITIGPNYTFGYKSSGTPELLKKAGLELGFDVQVQDAVFINNNIVSSTLVRSLLLEGNVVRAASYLGRNFSMQGKVISGDSRGRKLGFPTANLSIPTGLVVPADGVYAVSIKLGADAIHKGVANVGNNPTFAGNERRVEVFIFDFSANLYGQNICIEFIDRIRPEKKFTSAAELIAQIDRDICFARKNIFHC